MITGPQGELRNAKSEWRAARMVYAVYSGVVAHFDVGVAPCPEIECPIDRADAATRERVRNWLNQMDTSCPVTFLRRVLQSGLVGTEDDLHALIRRHLDRPRKTEFDREKLDFLLVQYFAQRVPDDLSPGELTIAEVGRVLAPVLGHWAAVAPHWLKDLEVLVDDVGKCHCMQDLEDHKVLERGRELKAMAGPRFYEPSVLIAFTRYNIILRRAFFYTMRADLDAVRLNLGRLQKLGVKSIDATRAGLSDHEALSSVHRVCVQWRNLFRTDYSSGHVFQAIKEMRACTDSALAETRQKQLQEHLRRRAERQMHTKGSAGRHTADDAASLGIELEVDLSGISEIEMESALAVFEEPPVPPQTTVERAYPELTLDSDPVAGTPARYKLPEVIDRIQAQIVHAVADEAQALSVRLDKSVIRLAWWEHSAFSEQGESVAAIRSSVAARLILQEAFDDFQGGVADELEVALTIAHGTAGSMQEKIAKARDARAIDEVVSMAATAQRLLELIREAEFALSEENL